MSWIKTCGGMGANCWKLAYSKEADASDHLPLPPPSQSSAMKLRGSFDNAVVILLLSIFLVVIVPIVLFFLCVALEDAAGAAVVIVVGFVILIIL